MMLKATWDWRFRTNIVHQTSSEQLLFQMNERSANLFCTWTTFVTFLVYISRTSDLFKIGEQNAAFFKVWDKLVE